MIFLFVEYESNFLGGAICVMYYSLYLLRNWKESIVIEDIIFLIVYSSLKSWQLLS